MASSATNSLKLERQATGENVNTWGPKINTALDCIDRGIAQKGVISLTGNHTMTATSYELNEAQYAYIEFTDGGLGSTPTVELPDDENWWWFKNSGSTYAITVGVSGGNTASIPVGRTVVVFCDGTDVEIVDFVALAENGMATTVDISLTAGSSEQMDFTVTVKDSLGATVTGVHCLTLWYSDSSAGSSVVTTKAISVTTGEFVAAGLFGTNLLNGAGIVATDANGVFAGSVIDSEKPADHYIVVKKPLGSGVVISDASGSNWGA